MVARAPSASSTSSASASATNLRKSERRGTTARNRAVREVKRTRTTVERELRQRRTKAERQVKAQRRREAQDQAESIVNRVASIASVVRKRPARPGAPRPLPLPPGRCGEPGPG